VRVCVSDVCVTVVEEGEDVNVYANDRCLVIVNHQDSLDVPILILALQAKRNVCRHMTWVIDAMFKYSNFGFVGGSHGDIFIESVRRFAQLFFNALIFCMRKCVIL
jgi:1-acyl-sn-glycerol-3-phosphate acyltransferase